MDSRLCRSVLPALTLQTDPWTMNREAISLYHSRPCSPMSRSSDCTLSGVTPKSVQPNLQRNRWLADGNAGNIQGLVDAVALVFLVLRIIVEVHYGLGWCYRAISRRRTALPLRQTTPDSKVRNNVSQCPELSVDV